MRSREGKGRGNDRTKAWKPEIIWHIWEAVSSSLLEKEMATHSSILAFEIPRTEESGRVQPWGHKESDTTEPWAQVVHCG